MHRIGRALASVAGLALAAGFVATSGAINFSYLSRQAVSETEGHLLGLVAIGVTGYNALGLMFASWALENGRRAVFGLTLGMWIFFAGFSLSCAAGFTATQRGEVVGARAANGAALASATKSLEAVTSDLASIRKPLRTRGELEEALNEDRQDRRWTASKACTAATVEASREYCRAYFQKRQELEQIAEYARLTTLAQKYRQDVLTLKAAGAERETDPQAALIVRLSRGALALADVQLALNAWVAIVIEMGAALLPFLSTGHGERLAPPKRRPIPSDTRARDLDIGQDGTWQVQRAATV